MHEKLLNYFNRILPLNQEEIDAILETMVIKFYSKGEILLKEGAISYEAYFVLDGCVRQYYLVDGDEKTSQFYMPEQWVTSIYSFREGVPSNHYLACSTDSYLVVGNREKEEDLYRRFPKMESISRRIMEKIFAEQHEQMSTYITDSPEQRYLKLITNRSELCKLIPQYQIASYIGVKPESLSRIKKRIIDQAKAKS